MPERNAAVAEIEARIAGYLAEITEGRDADRAADYYTADAKLVGPGTEMGRSEVSKMLGGPFDGGVQVDVNRRTKELFVHGDVAYELASADDTLVNPDGSEQVMRNNLFIRWEKGTDGLWRFARVLISPRDLLE